MAKHHEERQRDLPLSKAVQIAWKNIRVRLARSLLVTGGIILAVAFLSYILTSNAFLSNVTGRGSQELLDKLTRAGVIAEATAAERRVETVWMVGLALLISFVGILNAMLMSVTERFKEIGTMKCLGAMDAFIVKLFLMESAFHGMVGAVIGLVVGIGMAFLEGLTIYGAETWNLIPAAALGRLTGLCFVVGTVLAIGGAIYPARQAARMTPVDAMRSEV